MPAAKGSGLHVGVAAAHFFVEGGLGDGQSFVHAGAEFLCAGEEERGGCGVFPGEGEEAFACLVSGHFEQLGFGGIEVLGVAWISDPDGLAVA